VQLETVHFDGVPGKTFFDEEVKYLRPLITLELDDFAKLVVFNESAVACEFLFECFQELLKVIFFAQSLQGGERLLTVPLLDTDVDVILLRSNFLCFS